MICYLDLTEFMARPITTGIQRIAGELCRYSPSNAFKPVRLQANGYRALPAAVIPTIAAHFRNPTASSQAEITRLRDSSANLPIDVKVDDRVLVPEVFDEPDRLRFFRRMTDVEMQSYSFIVYDLLPISHPQFFPPGTVIDISAGYYRVIRRANSCAFISAETRDAYYGRLKRTVDRSGPVLPLGSDSLGSRPARPVFDRPLDFTVLGTIEPRKNHKLILDAFEPLLGGVENLTLSFVGKMGWVDDALARRIEVLAANPKSGFRLLPDLGDDVIRHRIEQARATIYVSAAEGYGLPPVESLWAATPVIASRTIPSLADLATDRGIRFVDPLNSRELRRAVLDFLDDHYANRKVEEAFNLKLPTWQSFTDEVFQWCLPSLT